MCFIEPSAEVFNPEIEATMNEHILENVDMQLEAEDEMDLSPQLTQDTYGIHNLQNENSRENRVIFQ